MSAANKPLTPKLRFPEFREDGAWKESALSMLAGPVKQRAKNVSTADVLSLSSEHGIVRQTDYFGKQIAGKNLDRYLKIQKNDFVYNDRTTSASKYGTIKRMKNYSVGAVSPIYKCFRFRTYNTPDFWEYYFEADAHEEALGEHVNEGARAGRYNISVDTFLSIVVRYPKPREQQKIADCLGSLDELIAAHRAKLDALQDHKKGLLQQLFPAEGENTPKLRFPEFENIAEWDPKRLPEISKNLNNRRVPITASERSKGNIPYYGATGVIDYVDNYLFDDELLCISEDGANLVARTYPIAFTISGKTWVNNHAHILKFRESSTRVFVEAYLNNIKLADFLTGAAQPKLNRENLDSIPIPMPSPPEQQKIADCLSALDALITAQTERIAALKAHKKGLMQQLFPNPEMSKA